LNGSLLPTSKGIGIFGEEPMELSKRDKIRHLLRRFGLGASFAEVEFYEKLGVDGAIDRLIDYDKVEEGFDATPLAFALENKDGRLQLNPPGVAAWWTLRLLTTQRPLQEKLTLFWHDHFAVSASKVNFAPAMLQYNQTLRRHANGNFHQMLLAMSKDAAMIQWLDNNTNVRGKPNENFAREIMELFTLGIGNYSEKDIQEAARAFTGWNFRVNLGNPRNRPQQRIGLERVQELIEQGGTEVFTFDFREGQHDSGEKTILGNTGNFDGDDVCGILVGKPQTARNIVSKLWEWFVYEKPEPKVVDRLAKVYFDGGMEIRKILRAIAESDEFWSERAVRKLVKNPVDFTITIARQMGLGAPVLDAVRQDGARRGGGVVVRGLDAMIERQGMKLLFPPDVAGWDWGKAWITSATMLERIKVADELFKPRRAAQGQLGAAILQDKPRSSALEVVDTLLSLVDADVPAERKKALIEACERSGGAAAASAPRTAGEVVASVYRVLFASPEFQFC
jgi:uncharacterized protein (DUF1800 family)